MEQRNDGSSKTEHASLRLGRRILELRKAPSAAGSGYLGYVELYLDGEYEGYIGIPKLGGPQVMIYGRSQIPEVRDSHENPDARPVGEAPCAEPIAHDDQAPAMEGIGRLWRGLRRRHRS